MSATKVITKIGITKDKISSRGGIALFLRYIEEIGLYRVILNVLSTTSVSNELNSFSPVQVLLPLLFYINLSLTLIEYFSLAHVNTFLFLFKSRKVSVNMHSLLG